MFKPISPRRSGADGLKRRPRDVRLGSSKGRELRYRSNLLQYKLASEICDTAIIHICKIL